MVELGGIQAVVSAINHHPKSRSLAAKGTGVLMTLVNANGTYDINMMTIAMVINL